MSRASTQKPSKRPQSSVSSKRAGSTKQPSTINPTVNPSNGGRRGSQGAPSMFSGISTKDAASLPGSTYQPGCNPFESMKSYVPTIDYLIDTAKRSTIQTPDGEILRLNAKEQEHLTTLADTAKMYARYNGTEKSDYAQTAHTALKQMSRMCMAKGLTPTAQSFRCMYDQYNPENASLMAEQLDTVQAARPSTLARTLFNVAKFGFNTACSAATGAYDFLLGEGDPSPPTYVPSSMGYYPNSMVGYQPGTVTADNWKILEERPLPSAYGGPQSTTGGGWFGTAASAAGNFFGAKTDAINTALSSAAGRYAPQSNARNSAYDTPGTSQWTPKPLSIF